MIGETHQPLHFPIALGARHAEVAVHLFFGVGAFVLRDRNDAPSAQFREAADDRGIVAEVAVAVQLVELIERGDVRRSERTFRMTRHVDALPRREVSEDIELDLRVLFFERADLRREIDGLIGGMRFEIGDAPFEFE